VAVEFNLKSFVWGRRAAVEASTAEFATSRYGGAVARVQSRVSWEVGRLEREPSSSRESDDA